MILGFTLLDLVLVVILGLLALQGHRRGLWVVLGNLLGLAVGGAIAFFALPVVAAWTTSAPWRWVLLLVTLVLLLAAGQHLGAALGSAVHRRLGSPVLRRVDRILGAVAAVVVGALLMGLISFSAGSTGSTALTREVARSRVLTVIDGLMPPSVLSFAARTRADLLGQGALPVVHLPDPQAAGPSASAGGASGVTGAPEGSAATGATPGAGTDRPAADPAGQGPSAGSAQPTPAGSAGASGPSGPSPQSGQTPAPQGQTASAPAGQSRSGPASSGGQVPSASAAQTPAQPGTPSPGAPTSRAAGTPAATAAKPASSSAVPASRSGAADAVVRLTGTAAACSQIQTGTGVAVAPDRVLTNAHVVAGVDAPTVLDRQRGVHEARIVLLDTARDIAVLAVDGANLPVAPLGRELTAGATATAMGYPDGGPFATTGARVQSVGEVPLNDIYGRSVSSVDVYVLQAAIRHGYSGGPVVAADGSLTGLVFGKAPGSADVGYALTADAIAATVARAAALSATVPSGQCVPGA